MASREVNVKISDTSNTGRSRSTQVWEITFEADWINSAGEPGSRSVTEEILVSTNSADLLGWMRNNHPQALRRLLKEVAWEIARIKYGLDEIEDYRHG